MQKNGEVDGFSVSPAHSHFSELGPLVDSRNATASSRVVKLPERVTHAGLRIASLDRPKLSRPVTSDGKPVKLPRSRSCRIARF